MAKSEQGVEKRKYLRVSEEDLVVCEPFDAAAMGGVSSKRMHGFTKSLSQGGILFESTEPFPVGSFLKLQLDLPGWEKYKVEFYKGSEPSGSHPLVVIAKVVRLEEIGAGAYDIGVVFSAMDAGHKLALKKYIERGAKGVKNP